MTQGNPMKRIAGFAVPMILGNVIQQLYSLADSVVVGRFVGKNALAAVGATSSVLMLIICIIIGMTMGTCILTAQMYGAGDEKKLKDVVGMAIYVSLGLSVCIGILGLTVTRPVLRLLGTPQEIRKQAYTYLIINTSTCIAPIVYNLAANIMRALGDSKSSLYALICSSVLNILLDLLFVIVFDWGVAGASAATSIAQGVSAIVCLIRIRKVHKILHITRENLHWNPQIFKRIVSIGIPMSIQNAISSIGSLGVQRMINMYGADGVAAATAAGKIEQLALMPLSSLGMAVSTYVGQNFGKKDYERIHKGMKAGALLTIGCGALLSVIVLLFSGPLTTLFVSAKEQNVIVIAKEYLYISGCFYAVCGLMHVFMNAYRGMGKMKISTIASCMDPMIRMVGAFVFSQIFGRAGMWFGWPAGWLVALAIPVVCYFFIDKWHLRKNEESSIGFQKSL